MTPNNIAGMAAIKGLNVLALTDHNTAKNCPAFFEACRRQGIIPIAGIELSTEEDIHLVCLFEELEDAMKFDAVLEEHLLPIDNRPEIFGEQFILNADDEPIGEVQKLLISPTDLPIDEAIKLARSYGAHVHPAHIDRESNGIIAILGDIPSEYGFKIFEMRDRSNAERIMGTVEELNEKNILVCSDAHQLWNISEAENSFLIDDEPYSSRLVRKRIFDMLEAGEIT
jgi:PHP family Zn ribbon phosphoesterase